MASESGREDGSVETPTRTPESDYMKMFKKKLAYDRAVQDPYERWRRDMVRQVWAESRADSL
jgi:hypothetical protein